MREPTGFDQRASRDDYRRILIMVENATNAVETNGIPDAEKKMAIVRLFRSQIAIQRLLLDELDRQDTNAPDVEETLDFDTDLRIMLDAVEQERTTEGETP